jgi:formylglycine-generating enzyme required for sulfatase activity
MLFQKGVAMSDWKSTLFTELAKRLNRWLAFAALMVIIGLLLWERLPVTYRPLPFLLALLGVLLDAILTMIRIRNQSGKALRVTTGEVEKSAFVGQNNGVLFQVVVNYCKSHPEVEQDRLQHQIEQYLDWVQDQFGTIILRGIEQEGRQVVTLPLESVYVPLQADTQVDVKPAEPDITITRGADKFLLEVKTPSITLDRLLSIGKRIILTGGPGCGKTTVLQHLAWTLSADLRGKKPGLASQKLGLHGFVPIPIYVPLSLYAAYLHRHQDDSGQAKSLAAYISDYLAERHANLDLTVDFFAHLLRGNQQVFLLLDGLDEVPSENERATIRQAIEGLASGRDDLHILVTSRTAAYQGRVVLAHNFKHVRVLPLQKEQINELVRHAFRSIYKNSLVLAEDKAKDLLDNIDILENDRQRRLGARAEPLVNSPLVVRMLLVVHFNERKLPDQRADLYQKAVDAMLRPDYTLDQAVMDDIERRLGSLALAREMLQYLAFHMHKRGDEQGPEISEEGLRQIFEKEPAFAPRVNVLLNQTRERGTLLEERGGFYRFLHLSFQEFLAGRYLAEMRDPKAIAQFLEDGPVLDNWWREPILLMIGYLDLASPLRARQVLIRLSGLEEKRLSRRLKPDVTVAEAEIAASAYLECHNQEKDLQVRLQEQLQKLLTREENVKPLIRANAADVLDRLGWLPPDLDLFVPVPNANTPSFWIARYPVTNVQYERFLKAPDFAEKRYWMDFPQFDEQSQLMAGKTWGETGWNWLQESLKDSKYSLDYNRVFPGHWNDPLIGISRRSIPVTGVSWYEANAYCKWLLAHWTDPIFGFAHINLNPRPVEIRLPTEKEWVQAAGGEFGGRFPWDKPDQATIQEDEIIKRTNVLESGIKRTTTVSLFTQGASPCGAIDMAGNVFEWQGNFWNIKNNKIAVRGGTWVYSYTDARVSEHFSSAAPDNRGSATTFRVCIPKWV